MVFIYLFICLFLIVYGFEALFKNLSYVKEKQKVQSFSNIGDRYDKYVFASKNTHVVDLNPNLQLNPNACWLLEIRCVVRHIFAIFGVRI